VEGEWEGEGEEKGKGKGRGRKGKGKGKGREPGIFFCYYTRPLALLECPSDGYHLVDRTLCAGKYGEKGK
jgi:hypothetical protein